MQNSGIKFVERTGIDLTAVGRIKMIKQVLISLKSDGIVTVYLGAQRRTLNDPVRWIKRTYDPQKRDYVSALISGRFLSIRIESSLTVNWILSKIQIETSDIGKY